MGSVASILIFFVYIIIIRSVIKTIRSKKAEMENYGKEQTSNAGGSINQRSISTPAKPTQASRPISTVTSTASSGESTTDYLSEKARLDQIEHAREKREETERLTKKAGGLQPAERLLPGDSIPAHKHCVICGYCAAENLIPDGSKMRYSCYFCREPL